jgi:hypothetical protein
MKTNTLLIALFLGLFFMAPSFAQDSLEDPGVTPDQASYGLKLGWEKFKLAFTFNQEKKAEKELKLAEKRLIEAEYMAQKGNLEGFERAQENHDKLLEKARIRLEKINEEGSQEKVNERVRTITGLEIALMNHEQNLERFRLRLEQRNLTEEQQAKAEEILERMQNQTEKFELKIESKKDNLKTRVMEISNLTQDEVEVRFEAIENKEGLNDVKEKISKKMLENAKDALVKLENRIENGSLLNNSFALQQKETLQNAINDAEILIEEGKYEQAIESLRAINNYGRNVAQIMRATNENRLENRSQNREDLQERIRERNNNRLSNESKDLETSLENDSQNSLNERPISNSN